MARPPTSRIPSLLRLARLVVGSGFAAISAYFLFDAVRRLGAHDYVASLVQSASGLFLVASATTLLRGELAE